MKKKKNATRKLPVLLNQAEFFSYVFHMIFVNITDTVRKT